MTIKNYNPGEYISEHFTFNELCCPCCHQLKVDDSLINKIEQVRTLLDCPISVTSCYRCPKHNTEVNGAKNSAHIYSYGIDWNCGGKLSVNKVIEIIHKIFGESRWGIYQSRMSNRVFVHTGTDYNVNNKLWISHLDKRNHNCYTYYSTYNMFYNALMNDCNLHWMKMYL